MSTCTNMLIQVLMSAKMCSVGNIIYLRTQHQRDYVQRITDDLNIWAHKLVSETERIVLTVMKSNEMELIAARLVWVKRKEGVAFCQSYSSLFREHTNEIICNWNYSKRQILSSNRAVAITQSNKDHPRLLCFSTLRVLQTVLIGTKSHL